MSNATQQLKVDVVTAQVSGNKIAVAVIGVPGQSGASSASYTHVQSVPLAVWTVAHNLGVKPSPTVVDSNDEVLISDVRYIDLNTLQVEHAVARTGKVYCN